MLLRLHVSSAFLFAPLYQPDNGRSYNIRARIATISQRSRLFQSSSNQIRFPNAPIVLPLATTSSSTSSLTDTDTRNCYWMVLVENPPSSARSSKYDVINHYVKTLEKVLASEKEAQMCLYNASIDPPFGFCCDIDGVFAQKLATLPEVLSVKADPNYSSDAKDYTAMARNQENEASQTPKIKTKKLFVSGLSFYTSENSLRAAFEGYGEISHVKVIIDPISKRSKGFGFVEYTTETAAGEALKEMNGKIINGWVIAVDVAKGKSRK